MSEAISMAKLSQEYPNNTNESLGIVWNGIVELLAQNVTNT